MPYVKRSIYVVLRFKSVTPESGNIRLDVSSAADNTFLYGPKCYITRR